MITAHKLAVFVDAIWINKYIRKLAQSRIYKIPVMLILTYTAKTIPATPKSKTEKASGKIVFILKISEKWERKENIRKNCNR